jgi:hypothetical protein
MAPKAKKGGAKNKKLPPLNRTHALAECMRDAIMEQLDAEKATQRAGSAPRINDVEGEGACALFASAAGMGYPLQSMGEAKPQGEDDFEGDLNDVNLQERHLELSMREQVRCSTRLGWT